MSNTKPVYKPGPLYSDLNKPKKNLNNKVEAGVSVNNQKVLRSADGRFLKGTPCPNQSGRPTGKNFKSRLNELVGNDSREIAILLTKIAFYDQKESKDRFQRFKAGDQLKALEMILKYKEVVPVVRTETTIKTAEDTKWKLEVTHVGNKEDKNADS